MSSFANERERLLFMTGFISGMRNLAERFKIPLDAFEILGNALMGIDAAEKCIPPLDERMALLKRGLEAHTKAVDQQQKILQQYQDECYQPGPDSGLSNEPAPDEEELN